MPLCEEAVTYGAAVAFSQLGRILICPRGRSCQQPMSCSCASLVPIVCPASPHMRKGMACVPRHHESEGNGPRSVARHHVRGLEQDEPVSHPHSTKLSLSSEESVLRTITGVPAPSQHHESAPLLLCGHPQPHFRSGARSRRVRSREFHTGSMSRESSDVAGVPRLACRPGFFLDASSMTRGVRPPFRRWMGCPINNRHAQRCRSVVSMNADVVHRCRWASRVLGRATHVLVRGGRRIFFRFRGPLKWTCACHHVCVFPGTAPGTFVFNLFSYGT